MMEAPENLVNAVNSLNPRAILVLDANVLMNAPRIAEYEIAAQGRFLLVVPEVVITEIANIKKGGRSKGHIRKATHALNAIDEQFDRGQPTNGIDLGKGRWMITTKTAKPKASEDASLEERQVQRTFGNVDAALLRLAEVCKEHVLHAPTLLVTYDRDLMRTAKSQGLHACNLAVLRSAATLDQMLIDRPLIDASISTPVAELPDPEEERPVSIAMTLEELRSDGDYLIARGIGRLAYDNSRYSFRWTFPFRDPGKAKDFDSMLELAEEIASMPLENVDFMGFDEELPDPVRRFVCSILESASQGGGGGLHSSLIRLRVEMAMELTAEWGPYVRPEDDFGHLPEWLNEYVNSPEELAIYNEMVDQHNQHYKTMLEGPCEHFGESFVKAVELAHKLDKITDNLGNPIAYYVEELVPTLSRMLNTAMDDWPVGGTREETFMYRPFAWAQEANAADEEDDEAYEDVFGDAEDELGS